MASVTVAVAKRGTPRTPERRAYIRNYMRRWRKKNHEVSLANNRDSKARAKARRQEGTHEHIQG